MLFQRKRKFVVKFNDLIHFQNEFYILPDVTKAAISCFERWAIQQQKRKLWKRTPTFHDPINSQWIKSIFALPPLAGCLFSLGKSYYLSEMGEKLGLSFYVTLGLAKISHNQGKSFKLSQGNVPGCPTLMTALHLQSNIIISPKSPEITKPIQHSPAPYSSSFPHPPSSLPCSSFHRSLPSLSICLPTGSMTAINHSASPPQPEGECFPWHSMKTTWPLFKEGAASSPTLWRIREHRPDATAPTTAGHKRQETAAITRGLQNIMPYNTPEDPATLNMQLIFAWRIMFHVSLYGSILSDWDG